MGPRAAPAALAFVQLATEPSATAVGFTARPELFGRPGLGWHDSTLKPLDISPRQRLDDALRVTDAMPMSGTVCALPMLHALEQSLEVDTFVVYTDNETWAGNVHPHQDLARYRRHSGIAARLIVVGMTFTQFTIADPNDQGMLDTADHRVRAWPLTPGPLALESCITRLSRQRNRRRDTATSGTG